jgi:hypothetical protein
VGRGRGRRGGGRQTGREWLYSAHSASVTFAGRAGRGVGARADKFSSARELYEYLEPTTKENEQPMPKRNEHSGWMRGNAGGDLLFKVGDSAAAAPVQTFHLHKYPSFIYMHHPLCLLGLKHGPRATQVCYTGALPRCAIQLWIRDAILDFNMQLLDFRRPSSALDHPLLSETHFFHLWWK